MTDHDGHRQRLRKRFLFAWGGGMEDYEKLELLLTYAVPRKDMKPMAKALLKQFHTMQGVVCAPPEDLERIEGVGESIIVLLRLFRTLSMEMLLPKIIHRPVLESLPDILSYARLGIGFEKAEKFIMIVLNIRDQVLELEEIASGTLDRMTLYPRELFKKVLNIGGSGIILIHNHPGGSLEPSLEDVRLTETIGRIGPEIGVTLMDHIIVTTSAAFSILGKNPPPVTLEEERLASEKSDMHPGRGTLPFHAKHLQSLRIGLAGVIAKENARTAAAEINGKSESYAVRNRN